MEIRFGPALEVHEPVIKPIPRLKTAPQPSVIDVQRSASVTSTIANLVTLMANSATRDEGTRRLKELPVRYFIALQPDKAAQAAVQVYKLGLMKPEELFDRLATEVVQKLPIIQKQEANRGLATQGRLTLGRLLNPGLRSDDIGVKPGQNRGFALHAIKESLQAATRDGNPYLAVILPQFAPKKS